MLSRKSPVAGKVYSVLTELLYRLLVLYKTSYLLQYEAGGFLPFVVREDKMTPNKRYLDVFGILKAFVEELREVVYLRGSDFLNWQREQ